MEVEQFEIDEIENNNKLAQPIFNKKKQKNKKRIQFQKSL